jgi:hypothetical protein
MNVDTSGLWAYLCRSNEDAKMSLSIDKLNPNILETKYQVSVRGWRVCEDEAEAGQDVHSCLNRRWFFSLFFWQTPLPRGLWLSQGARCSVPRRHGAAARGQGSDLHLGWEPPCAGASAPHVLATGAMSWFGARVLLHPTKITRKSASYPLLQ